MKRMLPGAGRIVLVAALLAATAACTRVRDHRGYIGDRVLTRSIAPGVDTRQSVQATLGRPTFTGQFDDSVWYYVSRETRQLAFGNPEPTAQTVIAVRFDKAGNVAAVERSGLDKVVSISPDGDKTPTLGRKRGFLSELFGNIGSVGSGGLGGQAGGSADNPQ